MYISVVLFEILAHNQFHPDTPWQHLGRVHGCQRRDAKTVRAEEEHDACDSAVHARGAGAASDLSGLAPGGGRGGALGPGRQPGQQKEEESTYIGSD